MSALSVRMNKLLEGASSLLSVYPARRPRRKNLYKPAATAAEALRKDWERLGGDIRKSAEKVLHGKG